MRLLLLAASGLLPLVLVLAWGIDHLFEERRNAAQRSALELSRALATAVDAEVRSIEKLLEQMGTSDELERADLRSFHLAARRDAEQLGWRQVTLADGEGHVLFRSNQPFDSFDRRPIDSQSLKATIDSHKPQVTSVLPSPKDGADTFAVRVPVMRGDQVVYVLTAVLSTDVIGSVLQRQGIPLDSVASVFDQQGRRISRSRQSATPFGSESLQQLLQSSAPQGTGVTVTGEGEEVYTGFTRLSDVGWTVTVGTSVSQVSRAFYALLGAIGLGLAGSLALALLLAWVLARRITDPIEKIKSAAAALGRGDPVVVPPLQVAELDDVAHALRTAAMERDLATQERVHALRMAEEANRSKDQFLAMLGHELRNPLAPIANAVQLMAMKGDEATQHERRIIERQLVHVNRLVDDLLDVSRITSGRLALNRKPVNIAHVLEQVVETIQPSLPDRTLALHIEPSVIEGWVDGDESRLVQVFNNLLVNAIKFTVPGNTIRIDAGRKGGDVRIAIEDDGVGIACEDLHHVFDLFYQAPQNADRARGGLGLGLPIVRSLVEMHGGHVTAESDGVGLGTCIVVFLPLCAVPAEASTPRSIPIDKGSGRVLVVDDNEDAADTCATLLEMSGYEVRVVYTPEDALAVFAQFNPGVAILDIGLPGQNGYELARAMRRQGYSGRLIAMTGYGQSADMAASTAAGFDAHLTKPVVPSELLERVARFAAETAPLRA